MFSYILGGACWVSASKLISNMQATTQTEFLDLFLIHLTTRFGDIIAKWSCKYYKQIEQQHSNLIDYLRKHNIAINEDLLKISLCVQLVKSEEFVEFIQFTNLFLKVPASKYFISCAEKAPKQQKICV